MNNYINKSSLTATFLLMLVSLLVGCASQPLKAPCDYHATFCGKKIKINQ